MRATQEKMQADIKQLKDQVSQILDVLEAMKNTKETPVAGHDEVISSYSLSTHPGLWQNSGV